MEPTIHVYADPIDPRGWGSEPALRRLRLMLPDADWELRPVVMVPDWNSYSGPELSGREAAPSTCLRVSEESGMPIDEFLWFEDSPATSGPGARGVAAALEQGETAGWQFLRAAREATNIRRTNIDTESAVVELANSVPALDVETFETTLASGIELPIDADVTEIHGVEDAGGRPSLPTVVISGDQDERGLSGFADGASIEHLVRSTTGAVPPQPSLSVLEVIERFSAEGWVAPIELSALANVGYDDAVAAARESESITEQSFASEPFFRDESVLEGDGESIDK